METREIVRRTLDAVEDFSWRGDHFLRGRKRMGFETGSPSGFGESRAAGAGGWERDFRHPGATVPSQRGRVQAGDRNGRWLAGWRETRQVDLENPALLGGGERRPLFGRARLGNRARGAGRAAWAGTLGTIFGQGLLGVLVEDLALFVADRQPGLHAEVGVLGSEELPELRTRAQELGAGLVELPGLRVAGLAALAEHLGGFQLGEAVAAPLPRPVDLGPGPRGTEVVEEAGLAPAGLVVLHPALGDVVGELLHTEQRRGGQMAKGVLERRALDAGRGRGGGGGRGIPGEGRGLGDVAGGVETGHPFHAAPSSCLASPAWMQREARRR